MGDPKRQVPSPVASRPHRGRGPQARPRSNRKMSTTTGQLRVERRSETGKGVARRLRAQGLVPAVLYGGKQDNESLTVDPGELRKALDPELRFNTFLHLTVTGGDRDEAVVPAIVAAHQVHPFRDDFVHVDFMRVDPEQEIVTSIPVEYVGRAAGVVLGGKLFTHRRTVKIAVKPGLVPVKLTVDVTPLESGKGIRVRDVTLENTRFLERDNVLLANVEAPRAAAEPKGKEGKK
ncbi:MAG: 50S ribosomal protein L25 [Myxococcales bacterium FL481]|nr:MAG: 50S ribosomal protein L25 [Myxococcales bacterium FL481]